MDKNSQYLFIDFEFTMPEYKGFPKGFFPEIIEVGLVFVKNQEIIDRFSSYVQPTHFTKLTERCKSFLHIEQNQVNEGITLEQLVQRLGMYKHSTIITWGNMDMKVLRQCCQKNKVPFPFAGKEIDLSMEYKRFFGDQNQTGLWKAVQEYGKEGTGKHHCALDDAMTTLNIFKLVEKDKRYLQKPEPTTIGDRIDFSKVLNKFAL
ncbi:MULTISPECIES: 3'-5' exonuclease KapD [Priestia]|uniref:Exonuclease (Sporulation inhibitor KapD) n=3 Tax=Priestia TaxID=2800373 RepID=D5DUP5_PRIM1|nr:MULTISPECIES: 3'-5' exonuclease KapD [Priestia]AVX10798.1 or 3'-5' exonuclease KapD [Bacillus sp. Y-01]KOP76863.1 sporulation inhibitor KapD [Bacillus sp. FJAT-21351]KQU18337.1 sporulation inhibitor KapD [Bacillus sp. Leaf75]KRD82773.1 sporulation inhibitor KapD [Bacillus sp. Root147]KRD95380.1 sporulation inhibitor KapD [Bacillus sp. Root239]KRF47669.1 sporulation inhibitor KapD [Bacillus sp. Soil531]MBZ5482018.1 3'-5' exonuclease KapD [Bacillus sp. T_4]MCF6798804.1 3'-5' exonuclease Ka